MYKTISGILTPDGKLSLKEGKLPNSPVEVMVTILSTLSEQDLSDIGDYNEKLIEYEEKLAKGRIRWK